MPGSMKPAMLRRDNLDGFFASLRSEGFVGGNVTVPHKLAVMKYCSQMDAAAQAIGAVNTIWTDNGQWVGGNTDAIGFLGNLDEKASGWDKGGRTAVILGAGGAARAAIYGLKSRGFEVHLVNRTLTHAAALAEAFGQGVYAHGWGELDHLARRADLLVNTTALGMQGKPALAFDPGGLKPGAIVHDIVYVPLETALLRAARLRGHRTVDGLGMLLHQAVAGFAHWFGAVPTVSPQLRAVLEADIRDKTQVV